MTTRLLRNAIIKRFYLGHRHKYMMDLFIDIRELDHLFLQSIFLFLNIIRTILPSPDVDILVADL